VFPERYEYHVHIKSKAIRITGDRKPETCVSCEVRK
jgi:hypothetical protein